LSIKQRVKRFLLIAFCVFGSAVCSVGVASAQNPVSGSVSVSPSTVPAGGKGTARVAISIDGGWKMYSITQGAGGPIPTRITLGEGPFTIAGVSGPRPKVAMDPNFQMNTETHSGSVTYNVGFTANAGTAEGPQTLNVNVRYQVCNDTVCLPPRTLKLSSAVTIGPPRAASSASPSPTPTASPSPSPGITPSPVPTPTPSPLEEALNTGLPTTPPDQNSSINSDAGTVSKPAEGDITNQPIWGFIWLAISFGALSLLTPCVFPMIPITVSYFTKHGADSRLGSIRDAGVYAFGIILTFTALGILLAVIFGAAGINRFASNPYVNLLITGIFLAFAFSLLGAYNLGVPSSVLTKLDGFTRSKESGKFIGLLLMGLTFSLTSFTCTAPLVGTILVSAAGGDLFYPVVGMLAFSSVFALPFFILALAPNLLNSLPRSGSWMNSVKVVMGFLEVGAALKFLSNVDLVWGWGIFTREVVIAGWIGLSILIFLYLLGVYKFSHDSDVQRIGLVRVLNAFLFATLTFYLLTGLFGGRLGEIESFLPPMKQVAATSAGGQQTANGELVWLTNDYAAALKQAKEENRRIFIDFTGYTCTNCRWMEANMFPKSAVRAELEKFVRVKLFTDGEGEPYEGFQKMQEQRFGTVALPLYAIITPDDQIVARFEGLTRNEGEFVNFLKK
jgi:thiol:disulfide interchange protein